MLTLKLNMIEHFYGVHSMLSSDRDLDSYTLHCSYFIATSLLRVIINKIRHFFTRGSFLTLVDILSPYCRNANLHCLTIAADMK